MIKVGNFTANTLVSMGTRVFQMILGFATSIIIARSLGPEGRGIYSLAILLPAYLSLVTQPGLDAATVYYIGRNKYPIREMLGTDVLISIVSSCGSLLIGVTVVTFFSNSIFPSVEKQYLFIGLFLAPFQIFSGLISYVLLGLQRINNYNFLRAAENSLFCLLIVIGLFVMHFGVKAAISAQIVSVAVCCILCFFAATKVTRGLIFSINKNLLRDLFSYGGKSFFTSVFLLLHLRIDAWMINLYLNPREVGLYYIAARLSEEVWLLSVSAGLVLFPKVSSERDEKSLKEFTPMVCRNILAVTFASALVLAALGPWIVRFLYSNEFLESVAPFQILLIGAVSGSASRIIVNDFAGRGRPMINTCLIAVSTLVNVALNILFIPAYGIIGSAWVSTLTYSLLLVLSAIIYCRISGNTFSDILILKKSDLQLYKRFFVLVGCKLRLVQHVS